MCTVVIVSTTGTDQEDTMTAQTTRYEAEVDTQIAAAYGAYAKATEYLVGAMKSSVRRTRTTGLVNYTDTDAVNKVIAACAASTSYVVNRMADNLVARRDQYIAAREAFEQAETRYEGWRRYVLVPGGHIHNGPYCHSLNPSTQRQWLPELSGLDVNDAVAQYGEILCSHCFPDAPVAWTLKKQGQSDATDDNVCPGSGTGDTVEGTQNRHGYAVCQHCNEMVAPRSKYNWSTMRKHKIKK